MHDMITQLGDVVKHWFDEFSSWCFDQAEPHLMGLTGLGSSGRPWCLQGSGDLVDEFDGVLLPFAGPRRS